MRESFDLMVGTCRQDHPQHHSQSIRERRWHRGAVLRRAAGCGLKVFTSEAIFKHGKVLSSRETNISTDRSSWKMISLFQMWDRLVPRRVPWVETDRKKMEKEAEHFAWCLMWLFLKYSPPSLKMFHVILVVTVGWGFACQFISTTFVEQWTKNLVV